MHTTNRRKVGGSLTFPPALPELPHLAAATIYLSTVPTAAWSPFSVAHAVRDSGANVRSGLRVENRNFKLPHHLDPTTPFSPARQIPLR